MQPKATPLERCETLAFLYTLGGPIALWTLRFADGGEPIAFPGRGISARYPHLRPAWLNFYDRDDVIGYPLWGLSDKYDKVVTQDRAVAVGPRLVRSTPVAHPCCLTEPWSPSPGWAIRSCCGGWRRMKRWSTSAPAPGSTLSSPLARLAAVARWSAST